MGLIVADPPGLRGPDIRGVSTGSGRSVFEAGRVMAGKKQKKIETASRVSAKEFWRK